VQPHVAALMPGLLFPLVQPPQAFVQQVRAGFFLWNVRDTVAQFDQEPREFVRREFEYDADDDVRSVCVCIVDGGVLMSWHCV
jgi:hypothetical protein